LLAAGMTRSLASLTITFGLVAIPVRLHSVTKRSTALRFRWMTAEGDAVRQQWVAEPALERAGEPEDPDRLHLPDQSDRPDGPSQWDRPAGRASVSSDKGEDMPLISFEAAAEAPSRRSPHARPASAPAAGVEAEAPDTAVPAGDWRGEPVGRADLHKALEIEPGRFVLFTQPELDALATPRRDSIDLVSFVPPHAVDPMYVDKSYYLAPVKRAERPYALLLEALRQTRRCALATWAWRGPEHPALLRPGDGVLVLHQLQSGDAVRDASELGVELPAPSEAELQLAVQLIQQSSTDTFQPMDFIDPARQRILEAARRKLAGGSVFEKPEQPAAAESAQIIDLVAALRASLVKPEPPTRKPPRRSAMPAGLRPRAARR
jgi:DNA end-binding protein Ku